MPQERPTRPPCAIASAATGLALFTCALASAALFPLAAHAIDARESESAINLGQGLRLAPAQRQGRSTPVGDNTEPLALPGIGHTGPIGDAGGPLGLSLWRGSNWLTGDRISLNLSGNTRGAEGLRLREDSTNGSMVGISIPAPGLRSGSLSLTSELLYSTPIGRHLGLGLSIMQRSSGLRDTGVADERMLSLRFSGQF